MWRVSIGKVHATLMGQRTCIPATLTLSAMFSTTDEGLKKKRVSGYASAVPKWKKDRAEKFKVIAEKKKKQRDFEFNFDTDDKRQGRKSSRKAFNESTARGKGARLPDAHAFTKSDNRSKQKDNKVESKLEKQPKEEPAKSLHEIHAEQEEAWNAMRKLRVLPKEERITTPVSKKRPVPRTKSAPTVSTEDEASDAIAKRNRFLLREKAKRLANKQNRIFDGIRAPPQDVVEPINTYEEPDSPRGAKPRGLNVAVIGRPNAGKSSLMNALLGFNVSAVSAKYNTTRDRVLGVMTEGDTQIAFYDTPGLVNLKDSHTYVRSLAVTAAETMPSVDVSLLVVDAVKRIDDQALEALKNIAITSAKEDAPIMLVMNKMDLVGPAEKIHVAKRIDVLSDMIEDAFASHSPKSSEYSEDDEFDWDDDEDFDDDDMEDDDFDDEEDELDDFDMDDYDEEDFEDDFNELDLEPTAFLRDKCFKVSAFKEKDVDKLRQTLIDLAVARPWMYHSKTKSDRSDLDLVTEIIREKLFRRFNQELPYMITQENRGWTPFSDKSLRIDQDLWVPSDRHIKTLLGKNGNTLREIGTAARVDIQKLLHRKVHLYLNVRSKSGRR
ncbi:hypothetical protein Ae201684P_001927 [Aphanomyces euteiches]|uniref:Era-type G domain-containing protein n=1 Tax=Aphanomyces euteiches TaxID=100861 RepID=A0A6G0XKY2_9STRA|nr:hypothetical protein Ae201684_003601 [Aphanomyces euteiches]KAH9084687.1 hypothetical protein Ae201684P_001927 [Aphanomyces euteiches]